MRVFAVSDLHVDYSANVSWIEALSTADYQDDALIVAGDLSHKKTVLLHALFALKKRFRAVFFVPGNHDLWVHGNDVGDSLARHEQLAVAVEELGVQTRSQIVHDVLIVPMLSWYDFSFGRPGPKLNRAWMDFRRCRWPQAWDPAAVTAHFLSLNPAQSELPAEPVRSMITFSHFMPRADLLPHTALMHAGYLLPILGSWAIDRALRAYQRNESNHSHVYGHSHVNVDRTINGVRYCNNARGYPSEYGYKQRQLLQITP